MVVAICGLANAADAVEVMSAGLFGTAAESDLRLTPQRQGMLNACILAGMLFGASTWGMLGDRIGGWAEGEGMAAANVCVAAAAGGPSQRPLA